MIVSLMKTKVLVSNKKKPCDEVFTVGGNIVIRDWSLITGRGGGGGSPRCSLSVSTSSRNKRLAEKVLAMLKGGHKQFLGSFHVVA